MGETSVQTVAPTATLSPVLLQAVPAAAAIPTPTSIALIQEGDHAGGVVVQDRVMQQLRWIKKLVFVAIFLALYAIMKKQGPIYMCVCHCVCMLESMNE